MATPRARIAPGYSQPAVRPGDVTQGYRSAHRQAGREGRGPDRRPPALAPAARRDRPQFRAGDRRRADRQHRHPHGDRRPPHAGPGAPPLPGPLLGCDRLPHAHLLPRPRRLSPARAARGTAPDRQRHRRGLAGREADDAPGLHPDPGGSRRDAEDRAGLRPDRRADAEDARQGGARGARPHAGAGRVAGPGLPEEARLGRLARRARGRARPEQPQGPGADASPSRPPRL